jgi:hypothetical protein
MPITEAFAGTEAVGATEHSCTTDTAGPDVETSDGVFQAWFDVSDMIAGDQLQVRVYEKVQASDTQRLCHQAILTGAQSPPIYVIPSLVLMNGWDMTLKTLAGTSIIVTWSIRKVA